MQTPPRRYSAGQTLEDYCRACKADRNHTIIVTDQDGQPLRVACGFCHSEHNFRGGGRTAAGGSAAGAAKAAPYRGPTHPTHATHVTHATHATHATQKPIFPIVSDREVSMSADRDLEMLLRRVIREETGITPVAPADRWRGGALVLRPGTPGVQEKTWPIETFFHKVVMLRNRLRTLEQQVNAAELPDDVKVKLQGYITGCYGSLTSFNVLFADEEDQFKGSGGE